MAYLYDLTDTWNAAGTVFNAIKMNVTNTASAAGSKIVSLQVGSTDRFTVDKDGNGYFSGTLQAVGSISSPNAYISGNSGTIGMQDNSASILAYNGTGSGGITNTLRFITGAAERVRIDGSGNVGIGTSSPSSFSGYTSLTVSNPTNGGLLEATNGTRTIRMQSQASGSALIGTTTSHNLGVMTAGVERVTLDTSGNLGLGVTPSSWYTGLGLKALQVGEAALVNQTNGYSWFQRNAFADASNVQKYITNGYATRYQQGDGVHSWSTAPSGTAGSAITFTQAMTLDASGNLLVGTTTTEGRVSIKLPVVGAYNEQTAGWNVSNGTGAMRLWIANLNYAGVGANEPWLHSYQNINIGSDANIAIKFISGGEKARITSDGNLLVGTTTNSGTKLYVLGSSTSGYAVVSDGSGALLLGGSSPLTGGVISGQAALRSETAMLFLGSGGTERMRIDSSGNLGIGTSSPTAISGYTSVSINNATNGAILDLMQAGTMRGRLVATTSALVAETNGSIPIVFSPAGTERARIDSSGNLLVGTTTVGTANNNGFTVITSGTYSGNLYVNHDNAATNGTGYIAFGYNGGVIGSITQNGTTAVAYNTTSDYRLKDIDGPIQNSGAYIDALKPVQGSWKADGSRFIGLIAHEVQEVSETQIATGVKDGEEMQAMDYSAPELIANLIAEIQSLRARVAQLEGN